MNDQQHYQRYQELQRYVGWTNEDEARVASLGAILQPVLPSLIDDFYEEIARNSATQRVITGGLAQVARLKMTLLEWLGELFCGKYDADYVARRWRVGSRHVEIGLAQVYVNAALSRLRRGLHAALAARLSHEPERMEASRQSLMTLLDLDLAIIEDAYQAEYTARQQRYERLATIGRVAGGVAHELRNPLNVVKTSVYYLVHARQATPEKIHDHLQRIGRQVSIADDVISALSDFAKLPVPERRRTDVVACINSALQAEALPSGIEVDLRISENLPLVLIDEKQVRIAFANLIRNARDAMPEGGRLTISCVAQDGHVDIAVADTGVGIPPENLRQIMEPFFSTKARGIGLGLALARAILDKNEGHLDVTSRLGHGSTFVVRLQAVISDAAAPP